MAYQQPQTTGNALIEKAQSYVDNPDQVSEFELKRLEKEADQLAKVDAATASTVKAAIAVCRWQPEEVEYWTNNALKNKRSFVTLANAAVNYRLTGNLSKSVELTTESYRMVAGDPESAENAFRSLLQTGRYQQALDLVQDLVNKPDSLLKAIKAAEYTLQTLKDLGIDPDEVVRKIEIGARVAMEQHARIESISMHPINDHEDGMRLVAALNFPGDIQKEIALEDALVAKFYDDETWDPMKFNVEFHYMTNDELLTHRSA